MLFVYYIDYIPVGNFLIFVYTTHEYVFLKTLYFICSGMILLVDAGVPSPQTEHPCHIHPGTSRSGAAHGGKTRQEAAAWFPTVWRSGSLCSMAFICF